MFVHMTLYFVLSGCKKVVLNEGMPIYRNHFEKGNLIINFDITFPGNKFAQEPQLKVMMRNIVVQ
jgi:DnaJ family protein A protein 2